MTAGCVRNIACFLLLVQLLTQFPASDGLKCYEGNGTLYFVPETEVECVSPAQCMASTYTCTDRNKCLKFGKILEDSIRLGRVSAEDMEQTKSVVAIIGELAYTDLFYSYGCATKCKTIKKNGLKRENVCCSGDLCNFFEYSEEKHAGLILPFDPNRRACYKGVKGGYEEEMSETGCEISETCVTRNYVCADPSYKKCRRNMRNIVKEAMKEEITQERIREIVSAAMNSDHHLYVYACQANCTSYDGKLRRLSYSFECCKKSWCNKDEVGVEEGEVDEGGVKAFGDGSAEEGEDDEGGAEEDEDDGAEEGEVDKGGVKAFGDSGAEEGKDDEDGAEEDEDGGAEEGEDDEGGAEEYENYDDGAVEGEYDNADGLNCYDGIIPFERSTLVENKCKTSKKYCGAGQVTCVDPSKCRAQAKVWFKKNQYLDKFMEGQVVYMYGCYDVCKKSKVKVEAHGIKMTVFCCAENLCNTGAKLAEVENDSSIDSADAVSFVSAMIASLVACVFLSQYFIIRM